MRSAFENAFMHAPIGMALVDMSGSLLRVNDALCRITGYGADEVYARSFDDLSDPHDVDLDAHQMEELRAGAHPEVSKRKAIPTRLGPFSLGAVERLSGSRR